MAVWHITYQTRDGATDVGRVSAESRSQALSAAATRFHVPRASVQSAVRTAGTFVHSDGKLVRAERRNGRLVPISDYGA